MSTAKVLILAGLAVVLIIGAMVFATVASRGHACPQGRHSAGVLIGKIYVRECVAD